MHAFEINEYRNQHYGARFRPVPDGLRGNVAAVRNYILQHNREADVCVLCDDDVSQIFYFEANQRHKLDTQQHVEELIERGTVLCEQWGYVLWGIQCAPDKQCYREYTPFSTLSYVSASFSCFLKRNRLRYDERFSLKEDYDMHIQQCHVHRGVLRFNKYCYVKKGAGTVGGCSSYRNVDEELRQIQELQNKWGRDIVRMDRGVQNHKSEKRKTFDINPIIKIPIKGV